MPEPRVTMQVRSVNGIASIIDIRGELTAFAEQMLTQTYRTACTATTRAILLNFSELEYMNSSGIGLIVTLLIQINQQKQRLIAYGLSEHYQHIFSLTRLSDAMHIYQSEGEAIKALKTIPGVLDTRFRGRR